MPLSRVPGAPAFLAGALLLLAACAGGPGPSPAAPSDRSGGFVPVVDPFPVSDSAGRRLDLAFLGGFNQPRPQLLDVDGDGDLDLVIQEYSGRLILLERDGTAEDRLPRWVYRSDRWLGLDVGEWSRFADLDGDGRPDMFAEWPFSYLRYHRNVGTPRSPMYVAAADSLRDTEGRAIFSDRQNIPQIVDIDCNGRPDLLIGRITGIILRYELEGAPGPGGQPVFRLLTERWQDLEIVTGQGSLHGANTMAFADHDGDGDLDLFWGDFFEAGLLLFENVGTCERPVLRQTPVRFPLEDPVVTSGYDAPAFGDLDGDGLPDLVVGVLGGAYDQNRTSVENLIYYSRDRSRAGAAGARFVRRTAQLLPMVDVGSESMPVLADLDGDGDLDLLLANKIDPADRRTSRIYRFENVGTRTRPELVLRGALPMPGAYHYAPAVGDLDGDGVLDMLVGNYGATLQWFRLGRDGVPIMVDSAAVTIPRGSNTTPALGDLDGDGDLDLLIGEASGTLNYYRNDGTSPAPRWTLVSEQYEGIDVGRRSAPVLVDLDGDGDLDLLIGSEDQGLVLYRNEGSRTQPRFVMDPSFRPNVPPIAAPAVGDLVGDGDVDIVVGTVGGGVTFFENPQERTKQR